MTFEDMISGKAGLPGIQQVLNGRISRRKIREEVQAMLQSGYQAGTFHLTRAKFKPDRKILAYFNFLVNSSARLPGQPVHLAVEWNKNLNSTNHAALRVRLQDEAVQAGLLPVQRELWRDDPEQGIRFQMWPLDPDFPQLVHLGDPIYVSRLFNTLEIAEDQHSIPVVSPIRYRPGERHVLRYDMSSPRSNLSQRQRLYAKLYTNAQDTVKAFHIANQVVDWLAANPVSLQGNRPQAMSQDDGLILYPHAAGIPLSHLLYRSPRWLGSQLRTIGAALAVLHRAPEKLQSQLKQNTFANEVKVVKRASEHLQVLLPPVYDQIVKILENAQERYSCLPQENPAFTHSDFKSDHLLYTPQGLTLIDFDTCTLADPALDIGKFMADLEWWSGLKGLAGVEEAQAELIKGYLSHGDIDQVSHERLLRARFFQALILVKIIVRRVPIYHKTWASITARMVERTSTVLQAAMESM